MRYILAMTLSGSTFFILYLLAKGLAGSKFTNSWRYRMLKAALLYYLIPMPFLNHLYTDTLRKLRVLVPAAAASGTGVFRYSSTASLTYSTVDGVFYNSWYWYKFAFGVVWLSCALGIFLGRTLSFIRWRKQLRRFARPVEGTEEAEMIRRLGEGFALRRKVKCYKGNVREKQAFSFGIIKPALFYSGEMNEVEKESLLAHEFFHIKRGDVFWTVLLSFAQIFHWFNPFMWWMAKEFGQVSEMSCDDFVLQDKEMAVRERYAKLLIEIAQNKSSRHGWSTAMSKKGRWLKERVKNVMKENIVKGFGSFISVGIIAAALLLNSVTALAYEDVRNFDVYAGGEDAIEILDSVGGETVFVEDWVSREYLQNNSDIVVFVDEFTILYDRQFVDDEGNIYPVIESTPDAVCDHQYVTGTIQNHSKNSTGGCTTTVYSAKRCSICGDMVIGEKVNSLTYEVCPH